MVNLFTHKRFLGDRKVIYEPEEFFKTRVVESVREGLYELSSEAKALIALEIQEKLENSLYSDTNVKPLKMDSRFLGMSRSEEF